MRRFNAFAVLTIAAVFAVAAYAASRQNTGQPAQAGQPPKPSQPAQNAQPGRNAQPVQPAEPAQPAKPLQPAQPAKPAQPANSPAPAASAPAQTPPLLSPAPQLRIKKIEPVPGATTQPATSMPAAASQPTILAPENITVKTPTPAEQAFERLKSLAGTWEMENAPLAVPEGIKEFKTVFRVTAGGKTVLQTDFPDTVREYVNMYHMDGDSTLVVTHYCPLNHQTRMRATNFDDPQRLSFVYHDSTNLDVAKNRHCHNTSITFISDDRIQQDWAFWVNGEQYRVRSATWKRVKN